MAKFKGEVLALSLCLLVNKTTQTDEELVKERENSHKCATARKMEVLPGRGWDNLRNKDMGQVLKVSYDKCKTTEDGMYLLPDHVSAIAIKESNLDLTSEFIEHYTNYTSITAKGFKAEASGSFYDGLVSVSGSFGTDYQKAKQHQVDDQSMTTRIQVRNTVYLLLAQPSAQVDPSLEALIMEAAHEVETNNNEKAQLIMELIVRDYGTHYLSHVDAGAILAEEDFITSKFVKDNNHQKNNVTAAAGVNFLSKFGFGGSYMQSVDNELGKTYKESTTSTHVRAYGGSLLEPNLTVHQWSAQIANNLVATDRGSEPLSFIFTPQKFPNITLKTLGKLRILQDGAIKDYYSFNTHVGCMSLESPNFEYQANFDDNSCKSPYNNYTFAGVYQTCTLLENDAGDICGSITQTNPLTGLTSCPFGYDAISLHTGITKSGYQKKECFEVCTLIWLCVKTCHMVYHQSTAKYNSFWCGASVSIRDNTGFMFGGLYTTVSANPVTKSQSCPSTYVPLKIGIDLKVCVSNDYELGFRYSIPFGGFFSCSQGNVLARNEKASSKAFRQPNDPYPHNCPGGYSQHMAAIDDNCEINYCVKANAFGSHGQMPVVRPPFHDPALMYVKTTLLLTLSPAHPDPGPSLGAGSIAGIVVSCVVVLSVVVLGAVLLHRRRAKNAGVEDADERAPLISEGSQYETINNTAGEEDDDRAPLICEGSHYGTINDTAVSVSPEV